MTLFMIQYLSGIFYNLGIILMYIKKTAPVKNKTEYYTFSLFHTYRDINNKIRNEALLNLGIYFYFI